MVNIARKCIYISGIFLSSKFISKSEKERSLYLCFVNHPLTILFTSLVFHIDSQIIFNLRTVVLMV